MMTEIQKHIDEILAIIRKKFDLEQMIFDINHLIDKISYKTINENGGDDFDKKKQLIEYEVKKLGSDGLRDYFLSLVEKGDLWLFEPAHYKIFAEEFERNGKEIIFFQVTVAADFKPEDMLAFSQNLSEKMQRRVVVDIRVDQSIIGGTIIKKDNYILDYSIKTKLTNLSTRWKESIQKSARK